jgi:TonB family protein
VDGVEVIESSGYGEMDSSAVNAAYSYRFSPALNVYGEPVACHVTRRIHFSLR